MPDPKALTQKSSCNGNEGWCLSPCPGHKALPQANHHSQSFTDSLKKGEFCVLPSPISAETGREPYKKEKLLKVIQGIHIKLSLTGLERAHDLDQLPFTKDNLLRKLFLTFP